MGEDGKPTQESLDHLYSFISERLADGAEVSGTYYAGADAQKINEYAESVKNDPDRAAYRPLTNNCFTFATKALLKGYERDD